MTADQRRRILLATPLALAGAGLASRTGRAAAQAAVDGATPADAESNTRLALLIGNRVYPEPYDLPPVHKNVRDLTAALQARNFSVTAVLDQDPAAARTAIQAFAKVAAASPANSTILFYYCGHGMQVDAENLMLGAGIRPDAREDSLLRNSLHLRRDVIDLLPRRPTGMSIAVIDACRTPVRAEPGGGGGFNQVEAPLGCLIAFSTGAGKPAIAPAVETINTFYTASLVKLLQSSDDELSFSDFFRLVKIDVQRTMQNHPVQAIRQFTQFPFIAENTRVRFALSNRPAPVAAKVKPGGEEEALSWRQVEASLWPADIVRLADSFLQRYPESHSVGAAQVAREGAADAVRALRSNEVRLYRGAFQPKTTDARWLVDWKKAARGDKDAANRIARAYARGDSGIEADPNRYEGWMQFAAELGNGIASYELAVYYRRQAQPVPAAQYETRARDLGYTPPSTLDNVRK